MRTLPNMVVAAPMDETELRNMMYTAQLDGMGPFSIRYPRGCGIIVDWKKPMVKIEPGKGRILTEGNELAILSIGKPGVYAQRAVKKLRREGISAAHYDMRFVKPLDSEILHSVFAGFKKIITVEDGTIKGGFGSAVVEFMAEYNYSAEVKILGVPDRFIEQGTQEIQYRECGIDAEGIWLAVRKMTGR